ncbi:MAG: dienelactone hydrolase family protein [Gammaproteobacteria bacterium]|nr:dienelactone hydrolase family protein [Gammaproteobacteria bacterium]MYD76632.1 dienelactone hydrolase family protein [Gammaproteobacteria bacterium]MYJ53162.1 dienelactone hydrolase family protein [Gammaproteobacteria bacterium]
MCDIKGCGNHRTLPPIRISNSDRRLFLKGLASLPLATVLAYPELARAAADGTRTVMLTTRGGRDVSAALAMPDTDKAPAVLLIHEWWGLNDQIRSVAAELARLGYLALAVDLYGGEVADTPDGARALMRSVDPAAATDILVSWIDYLKKNPASTGRVGTVGWCFGGGWSLNASLATPVDATVIYYGNVKKEATDLASLQGPVLGHFATRDGWIDRDMVSGFETAMQSAGKSELTVHWYEADHAFANPTSARYDADDAALSWERTVEFLRQNLG